MMNTLIRIATDPLIAGILWTEENDPSADHVEYDLSPALLEAMQSEYATGPLAAAIHDWIARKELADQQEQEDDLSHL